MAEPFRIALIGQAAFGESVLNALLDNGETVVGVFCPPDKAGKDPDPLKVAAEARNVDVYQFKRLRDDAAVAALSALEPELGIMAFVTEIVPESILNAPKLGTILYHPSLLPKHRGPSSMNWPIIQGETRTGLSIFWPDAGLDTGPILLQKETEIGPDDTLGSLYFDKLFPMGVDAIVESVGLVKDGTAPRIPQDESQATYEGWCKAENAIIDWSKPVDVVYNLIRGTDPSPGAATSIQGAKLQMLGASKIPEPPQQSPGTITVVNGEGLTVAARDGQIRIGRVRPEGSGKLPAADWATDRGIKAGDRFGD